VTLAQRLGITIWGFDISGTGESTIPLSVKGDELVLGIVNEARKLGNGKVAHLGFSFGGNFSAMTGHSGAVDEGAGAHSQCGADRLSNARILDWLDDTFGLAVKP
jgi:esterase FrsA